MGCWTRPWRSSKGAIDGDPKAMSRIQRSRELDRLRRRGSSGAELVALSLASLGMEWIAGVGGTPVYEVFRACAKQGLRVLGTRTQAGAVMMAGASAWVAGRPMGAVVLSAGPAITNAMTGILVAQDNSWPLLVLGGRRDVSGGPDGAFQNLDGADLIRPIAKWTASIDAADAIPGMLQEALQTACSGRPGPVYLDIPENVLSAAAAESGAISPLPVERTEPSPSDLEHVARQVSGARHPVLVLGDSVRWNVNCEEVSRHLQRSRVTLAPLALLRGLVPERDPSEIITAQHRARLLAQADLVLLLGCGLDWRLRFGAEIGPHTQIIQIGDTHVIPPQGKRRHELIEADPGLFLNLLAEHLDDSKAVLTEKRIENTRTLHSPEERSPPLPRCHQLMADVFCALRSFLPENAFLVLDGNLTLEAGQQHLPRLTPFSHLDPGRNGCMGTGIPFAMAARLLHHNGPVVLCTGDFAFGLGAIELETCIRHGLPIIVLVINNGGPIAGLHQHLNSPCYFNENVYAYSHDLAYEKMAEAFSMPSFRASTMGELRDILGSVFLTDSSALINVTAVQESPALPP